ncbi:hypothetical protein GN244_ATG11112 [Phytophthora infestans]|uniref:Uncharacterized protein n=1 Tax=Phytophthora infestans TaxID=4787 RepID=A0A833SRX3_PHYIN|nr:hypothetical protein GN244_ATG11112 [Phytophthora infestans]KAF4145445.1 hypothetical protein GN958_ATG05365 [Phytophthora infestans]
MKQRSQVNATAIFRVVVTATVDVKNDVRDGSDSGRRDDARNQPRDTLAEASLTDTVLSLNGNSQHYDYDGDDTDHNAEHDCDEPDNVDDTREDEEQYLANVNE